MGNRCNDDDNDVFCREEEDDADKYAARRNSLADLCVILLHRLLLDMAGSVYALEMCFRGSIDTVQGAAEAYNILCWLDIWKENGSGTKYLRNVDNSMVWYGT